MLICLPHGTEMQEEFQTSVLCYNYCVFFAEMAGPILLAQLYDRIHHFTHNSFLGHELSLLVL